MPTLAGINGASLNANILGGVQQGLATRNQLDTLGRNRAADERLALQDQAALAQEARRRQLLGLPQLGGGLGATPPIAQQQAAPQLAGQPAGTQSFALGESPQATPVEQSAPINLDQLAIEFPEEAKQIASARKAQFDNVSARDKQKIESVVMGAAQALASPDPLRALQARRQDLINKNIDTADTDEAIAAYQSGDVEGGNAMLQNMVSLGQQLDILTDTSTKPSTLQQNAIAAGLTPGTPEFQQFISNKVSGVLSPEALAQKSQIAAAGKTDVTVGGTDEGEERKQIAKVRSKQFERVIEAGENAETMLQSLDTLDAIDVDTGALEPAKAAVAAVFEGFGMDASGLADVDGAQSLKAASNRLVNDVLNQAKGPQTEGDAIRAKSTIANLGDSPLAKQFKSDSLRAVALRQKEQQRFIEDFMDENDETFTNARRKWNKFTKETPSLSAVIKNPQTGLPLYFYQFKSMAQQRRPGISETDVIAAWRQANAK
tara:strand:+ start:29293 stop:30762 length:1470 start_codon:yes stop_codon:yes gene_type:complete